MSYDTSAGWRIISTTTNPTDKYGWIQVERLDNGNAYLRCCWQNSRVVGFDSRNVGSYIYADKTSPGEFLLEDIDEDADGVIDPRSASLMPERLYNLSGQRVSPDYRGIVVTNGQKVLLKR